jgi:hypothetical protein
MVGSQTQHEIVFLIKTEFERQSQGDRMLSDQIDNMDVLRKVADKMVKVGATKTLVERLFGYKANKDTNQIAEHIFSVYKGFKGLDIAIRDLSAKPFTKDVLNSLTDAKHAMREYREEMEKYETDLMKYNKNNREYAKSLYNYRRVMNKALMDPSIKVPDAPIAPIAPVKPVRPRSQTDILLDAMNNLSPATQGTVLTLLRHGKSIEKVSKAFNTKLDPALQKNIKQMSKMTPVLKHVNSLMFGLLFGGMAMQRAFQGAFNKFEEMTGIFDIFNTALAISLFAFEPLLDIMIAISEFILDMPEWAQAGLGSFMVIFTVLGGILAFVGQFGVTLPAVITWIASFFGASGPLVTTILNLPAVIAGVWATITGAVTSVFGGIVAIIGGISAPIAIVLGTIALLVIGFVAAWRTNFMGIKESVEKLWTGIKEIFGGVLATIQGTMDLVIGAMTLNPEKLKEGWHLLAEGIKTIFVGVYNFLSGTFETIVKSIASLVNILWNLIPAPIRDWIESKWGAFSSALGGFLGLGGKPDVPALASGGIVTSPTLAMIGEKGPEAVIPLNSGSAMAGSNISVNNYFNNSINSSIDIRDMARQVEDSIFENLRNRLPSRV